MLILTECNLAQIVVDLLDGKTVVFPTETSYGLGCDATNQDAVDKIFKIKGRRSDKPLLVVVPTIEMAKKYLVWNELLEKIAAKHWPPFAKASGGRPGPLTVVGEYDELRIKNQESRLANGVVSKDNTVAIRVTAQPLLKSITEKLNRPLVATSANIADTGDIYSADEIVSQFKDREAQPDIILNQGELPKNPPTTIVSVVGGEQKILRQGAVKF
jgi:L-threonylcarbamoyladenylate synthase